MPIIETAIAITNAVKIVSEVGAVANGLYRVTEALGEGDLMAVVGNVAAAAVGSRIPLSGTIVKASSEAVVTANNIFRVGTALAEGDLVEVVDGIAKTVAGVKLPDSSGDIKYTMKLPDASGNPGYSVRLPDAVNLKLPTTDRKDTPSQMGAAQKLGHEAKDEPSECRTAPNLGEQSEIDSVDAILQKISDILSTPEGIKGLIEAHPEKTEVKSILNAIDTLNDSEATPIEKSSANQKIDFQKGTILELAVKDVLSEAGLSVEEKQRTVNGETGGTRPDVIAKNSTDKPISALGIVINPGEMISVECKCGQKAYLENQLRNHIPNQLSGHEGYSILLTTSDIQDVAPGLSEEVCAKYHTTLCKIDISAWDVNVAIKGVSL